MTYNPISVSQLNKYIKDKFEEDEYFANVLVEGEISNFKNHYKSNNVQNIYWTFRFCSTRWNESNDIGKCICF